MLFVDVCWCSDAQERPPAISGLLWPKFYSIESRRRFGPLLLTIAQQLVIQPKMTAGSSIIPARFLTTIGHLIAVIMVFFSKVTR